MRANAFSKFVGVAVTAVLLLSDATNAQTSTFNLATGVGTGQASDYRWNGTTLTINNGADIEITGSVSNGRRIWIDDNAVARVTLRSVSITVGGTNSAFTLFSNANVTMTLVGTNNLTGGGIMGMP